MAIGDSAEIAEFTVTLDNVEDLRGPNYLTTMADIKLARDGKFIAQSVPRASLLPSG